MIQKQHPAKQTHILYSLLMLHVFAWLTVCLPYVAHGKQITKNQVQVSSEQRSKTDNSNPLTDTNEETSENGFSVQGEYLPYSHFIQYTDSASTCFYKYYPSALYLAYHPKLLLPPPEGLSLL